MKGKKILVIIMAIIAVLSFSMGLGCNNSGDDSIHQHTFSLEWTFDETRHWHTATCEHTD